MLRTPHPPQVVPSTFACKLDSRFATCSPAGEGSRKSRFLAIDGCAFCDCYDIGPPRTPVPTIKKKYSIEIFAFIFIFLGSSRAPTPTGMMGIFVSATDGGSICNRYDLGRPMVAPTNDIEIVAFGYRPNKRFRCHSSQ